MARDISAYFWALLRLGLGWTFFWAFIDKLFGLGFGTASAKSWLAGNSPTMGFLSSAAKGPFAAVYNGIAGSAAVDWLFMMGLLLIGLSLLLGIGVKVAGYSGALMMMLMYFALLFPANNLFMDEHIIYAIILVALANVRAGHVLGLGKYWAGTGIVKTYRFLE